MVSFKEFVVSLEAHSDSKQLAGTRHITSAAVNSFIETVGKERENVSKNDIQAWVGTLLLNGIKISTAKQYLSRVRSIYKEWSGGNLPDPFENVLPALDSSFQTKGDIPVRNLGKAKRLSEKKNNTEDYQAVHIFLYLLYNPTAEFADVINLTFDTAERFSPHIEEVISAMKATSVNRKYVFRLNQGQCRPKQICSRIERDLSELMANSGMQFNDGFSRSAITAMWIAAAIKLKVPFSHIRSVIKEIPHEYKALSLFPAIEPAKKEMEEIICKVADTINGNETHWFVMKLRRGVKFQDISNLIEGRKNISNRKSAVELFYPVRTTIGKKNGKIEKKEIPYIPNMIFFKTSLNNVKKLFTHIGDMAWCLRTTKAPDSSYAIVNRSTMALFQKYIGQFTPDIKIEFTHNNSLLHKGRKVKVTGGIMKGFEGEIIDIDNKTNQRIFILRITNAQSITWTAEVDEVDIEVGG